MSFFLGAEKYFASPKFKISRGQLRIFVDGPVFLLQRREDFRLKIPQAQKVLFEIKLKNESNQVVSCAIKDLSAGGCRLLIDPKKWQPKVGDPIAGTILISGREPIIMEASIKHIKPDSTEKNKLSCGVQFNQISEIQKNRIAAIVMDLFRVFFAKLK
jgi:c-di-GMP-binding flagellar brake protein YcgR